jgi:hypothetical protein
MKEDKIYEGNIKFTKIYIKNEIINSIQKLGKTKLSITDILILKKKIKDELIIGSELEFLIPQLVNEVFIDFFNNKINK